MNDEHTLVASSNSGRYALDSEDGPDLTSGMALSIYLGGQWISGSVEHAGKLYVHDYSIPHVQGALRGYYFIAEDGGTCGLCVGMKVRTP